jgi:hypothetical protein
LIVYKGDGEIKLCHAKSAHINSISLLLMITTSKEILSHLLKVFPPLLPTLRKGDNGRIAVIGGSF